MFVFILNVILSSSLKLLILSQASRKMVWQCSAHKIKNLYLQSIYGKYYAIYVEGSIKSYNFNWLYLKKPGLRLDGKMGNQEFFSL